MFQRQEQDPNRPQFVAEAASRPGHAGEGIELGSEVWKFCFLFARTDEEQHVASWGSPSFNAPDEVCSVCFADRDQRPFVQCYGEESLIGTTVKVWEKVRVGEVRVGGPTQRAHEMSLFFFFFLRLEP